MLRWRYRAWSYFNTFLPGDRPCRGWVTLARYGVVAKFQSENLPARGRDGGALVPSCGYEGAHVSARRAIKGRVNA